VPTNQELPQLTDERKTLERGLDRRAWRRSWPERPERQLEKAYEYLRSFQPTDAGLRKLRKLLAYQEPLTKRQERLARLNAFSDGLMRPFEMYEADLAHMLRGDYRLLAFFYCTLEIDREWLAALVAKVMYTEKGYPRDLGDRPFWHRMRLIALLCLLQKQGVVRGIPAGLLCEWLGDWHDFSRGYVYEPLHRNTVLGYRRELRETGYLAFVQLPVSQVPAWCRGHEWTGRDGHTEQWAYNEYRLLGAWQRSRPEIPRDESEAAYVEWVHDLKLWALLPNEYTSPLSGDFPMFKCGRPPPDD